MREEEAHIHTHNLLDVSSGEGVGVRDGLSHAAALGHEPDVEGDAEYEKERDKERKRDANTHIARKEGKEARRKKTHIPMTTVSMWVQMRVCFSVEVQNHKLISFFFGGGDEKGENIHTHNLLDVSSGEGVGVRDGLSHTAALGHEPDVEGDGRDARGDAAQDAHLRENPHNLWSVCVRVCVCVCVGGWVGVCVCVVGVVVEREKPKGWAY